MDSTVKIKPKTMAELLPELRCMMSPTSFKQVRSTVKKNPRSTIVNATTSEKIQPMTIAQMFKNCPALESKHPRNNVQMSAAPKQKWNSSTKMVNKTVHHTANEPIKYHSVRKVLDFQPSKPKVVKSFSNSRATVLNTETPKFQKPEIKASKPLHQLARNNVRISGICNIPETPITINKKIKIRMTIANKENINNPPVNRKLVPTPKSTLRKKVLASMVPDTPLSIESRTSSGDDSFLQNEQDIETKVKALTNGKTVENIEVVTPPVSTAFTKYRNASDYLDNTHNHTEIDNTIMSLDNTDYKDNCKGEESIIVSVCEMLNKATITSEQSTELEYLLDEQKKIENNIEIVDKAIKSLKNYEEVQLKSLAQIKKLIHNKRETEMLSLKKNNFPNLSSPKENKASIIISKSSSVNKVNPRRLSYKIPKKTPCSKKKVKYQLTPNSPKLVTPQKPLGDKALSMYLQIKERNNYLTTPLVQRQHTVALNTPAMTSINLQRQLDRLYDES